MGPSKAYLEIKSDPGLKATNATLHSHQNETLPKQGFLRGYAVSQLLLTLIVDNDRDAWKSRSKTAPEVASWVKEAHHSLVKQPMVHTRENKCGILAVFSDG